MIEAPAAEVWVDARLAVGPSLIEGRGLVAADSIPAGTVVIRLGGRLVTSDELEQLIAAAADDPAAPYVDTVTIYEDRHLVLPPMTMVHFGNHSCDPNLWHVGVYEIETRRDVAAGEEVTIDYGSTSGADGFEMACNCGSDLCRGTVTSRDWTLVHLQETYGSHWTPVLADRIAGSRGIA